MGRRLAAAALLAGLVGPVALYAQAPPPVPALPDTERRTSYTITGSNCNCSVGFSLYGDSTDYGNWVQVFLNGTLQDPSTYTVTSPSGAIATLPRPITNAVLNFNALTTGTVQIVGGRRPRRTSTFSENRGVAARDLNQLGNDIEAQNREAWDLRNRSIIAQPGNIMGPLPSPAACANGFLTFDATGLNPTCTTLSASSVISILPGSITNAQLANMPNHTVKCNPSGVSASPSDCTSAQVTPLISTFSSTLAGTVPAPGSGTSLTTVFLRGDGSWVSTLSPSSPIMTIFASGTTSVFTPSAGTLYMAVEICGGGGGGGPTAGITTTAQSGSTTSFGTSGTSLYIQATGGGPGYQNKVSGPGGSALGGDFNMSGGRGSGGAVTANNTASIGGSGGVSPFGGAGGGGVNGVAGDAADPNSCSGGGGGGNAGTGTQGTGGAAGGYAEKLITQPLSASYAYTVGSGGSSGKGGVNGGDGGGGLLIIRMFFQ